MVESGQPFLYFCFSLCKIVDSEGILDNKNSLKANIGAIIKNPEILRFAPDYLKTKTMCTNADKKVMFLIDIRP